MNKKTKAVALQYSSYVLIFYLTYILQSTPGFLEFWGGKPVLLMPCLVSVAIFEKEYAGGLMGALAGMFCDLNSNTYFGFHAMVFLLFGAAAGLLCEYLIQRTLRSCLWLTALFMVIISAVSYFFQFGIWQYEGVGMFWLYRPLSMLLPTVALAAPFYFLFRALNRRFEAMKEL